MAINPKIKERAEKIRKEVYGKDVREALASGLEVMSEDVEETKQRQGNVESQFQAVLDETTGKDVISAPEVIAARVGADGTQYQNLKQRLDSENKKITTQNKQITTQLKQMNQTIENINEQLEQKASKSQLEKIDRETVRKEELNALNDRIDRIITTPAEGVSAQEIIDARQGEDSLGENISKIKDEITHEIQNKVINGEPTSTENWSAQYSTIDFVNNALRITGDGTNKLIRASQRVINGFVGGNKIYVKGLFRTSDNTSYRVGFSLYRTNYAGATISRITEEHPKYGEWHRVEGIVELADDGVGDLQLQVNAEYYDEAASNGKYFEVKNIVLIDLTEAFGLGNEPELEDIRSLLDAYPEDYLSGKAKLVDIGRVNIKNKSNKAELENKINELTQIAIGRTRELPVNRKKFNIETIELFSYENFTIYDKTSMYVDKSILFEGQPTFRLTSYGGHAYLRSNIGENVDLSEIDYIDFYFHVTNVENIVNLQIDLEGSGGHGFVTLNRANHVKEVKEDGYRMLRIHKNDFVIKSGNPDWSSIRYIRIAVQGDNVILNVGKVEASKVKSGVVFFYFDDATIDHYTTAFPIMEKYRLRGTISVPTERVGLDVGLGGQRVTWSNLREMQSAGWLVVSHGLDEKSLAEISPEEAERQIRESSKMLFEQGFYFGSKCIVAPQGSWSDEVDQIARKYLKFCRTTGYIRAGKGEYAMEFPQSHPRAQYYKSPVNTSTLDEVKGWIDNVIEKKKEIAIAWHRIRDMPEDTWSNSPEFFEEICAYVRQKIDEGVLECVTWQDVMLQSRNINPIDSEGNQYLSSIDGKPIILTL